MAEFQFLIDGKLVTYDRYEHIPETIDHVIKFLPDNPEPEGEDGNHTEEQHEAMSEWNGRLQKLMEKERAGNL